MYKYKKGGSNNRRMYGQARVVVRFQDLYVSRVLMQCFRNYFGIDGVFLFFFEMMRPM